MKDTVRDDERHHREVRRVDKEHAIEVEERHAYEPDNGDERMEVEDKEPYGSTIRQQRTDEDQKDANNMDRGEQRRDVENGQQNHPSQENSGQDEIGLSRHDQYQYELHEGRHPDSPPSQAADNNLHLLQHDTYNSPSGWGMVLLSLLIKNLITLNIIFIKLPVNRLVRLVSVPCPIPSQLSIRLAFYMACPIMTDLVLRQPCSNLRLFH